MTLKTALVAAFSVEDMNFGIVKRNDDVFVSQV
jgi:hypothetical protein